MSTRIHLIVLAIIFSLLAAGCNKPAESESFKLISTSAGDLYRLQISTGAIHKVSGTSLMRVSEVDRVQLRVGAVYLFENGSTMKYVGKGKFEPFKSDVLTLEEYLKIQKMKK